ncbi:12732_t:CDS:2, partial [Cetraspora pellucida]
MLSQGKSDIFEIEGSSSNGVKREIEKVQEGIRKPECIRKE